MKTHSQCGLIRTNFYGGNKNASALLMKRWRRGVDGGGTEDEQVFPPLRFSPARRLIRFDLRRGQRRRIEGRVTAHLRGVAPLDWIIGRRRQRRGGSSNGAALGGRNVFTASHRGTTRPASHCAGTGTD